MIEYYPVAWPWDSQISWETKKNRDWLRRSRKVCLWVTVEILSLNKVATWPGKILTAQLSTKTELVMIGGVWLELSRKIQTSCTLQSYWIRINCAFSFYFSLLRNFGVFLFSNYQILKKGKIFWIKCWYRIKYFRALYRPKKQATEGRQGNRTRDWGRSSVDI